MVEKTQLQSARITSHVIFYYQRLSAFYQTYILQYQQ